MTIPTIIALCVVAGFFLFIFGIALFRRSLGALDITISDGPLEPGGQIDAQIALSATKALEWSRITVALRCIDTADRGGSQPWHEIYRDEHVLAGPGSLRSGGGQVFTVRFVVPTQISGPGLSIDMPESIAAPVQKVGDFLQLDSEVLMAHRRLDIMWELVAEVERDNVSMVDTHRLDIDLFP